MHTKDILHSNPSGKHIVVMRRGHFYKFDVLDAKGVLFIFYQLFKHIYLLLFVYRKYIRTTVIIIKNTIYLER